ncbi:hypothetical protein RHECNPAF_1340092 [Rhizobium etli CNPAF512]|nr:hypothetical protein RHECNPAF_1340092 [Rhizobium etli CNPAF512]
MKGQAAGLAAPAGSIAQSIA